MKRFPWLMLFTVLLFAACSEQPSGPVDQNGDALGKAAPMDQSDTDIDLKDRYIVVFKKSVGNVDRLVDEMTRGNGSSVHFRYRHALKGFCATIPPQALEGLRRNPNVDYIEADGPVFASGTQTLPSNGSLWGLDRIDQATNSYNYVYNYPNDASAVNAYIIDTGIRYDHVEFGGRATFGYDAFGGTGADGNGHGTHVAGTVGGENVGVAKNVDLIAVRVLNNQGSGTTSGVIAGVDWVANNHVAPAVANMSLGGGASTSLDQAVASAVSVGVTFVVAAGNSNAIACNYSPAREPSAITVGSTTSGDVRSSFSNYGSCVDIFAPGSSIYSAYKNSSTSYATLSGTSMASPHVAGVAALYLQANQSATPAQVASALVSNATSGVVGSAGTGSPNLLVYTGFIGSTPSGPNPPTGLSASVISQTQINVSWNAVSGATGYEVESRVDGSSSWTSSGTVTGTSYNWTSLSANTTYKFRARTYDGSTWSSWSSEIGATTPDYAPSTPTGLSATAASSSQINTSWNVVGNATEYEVRILDYSNNVLSTVSKTTTSHSFTGLTANTTYNFEVRAGNSGGWSGWSSSVSATTQSAPSTTTAYVVAVSGTSYAVNKSNWMGEISVTVSSSTSSTVPVAGATVSVSWTGDASGSSTGVTNANGVATITTNPLNSKKVKDIRMQVTDVTGTNLTYGGLSGTAGGVDLP